MPRHPASRGLEYTAGKRVLVRSLPLWLSVALLAACHGDAAGVGYRRSVLSAHESPLKFVGFLPDNATVLSISDRCVIKLSEATTGKEVASFRGLQGVQDLFMSAALAPDGKTLAVASHETTLELWDVGKRELRKTIKHGGGLRAVAFSRDGKMLASCGGNESIHIWDPATGKETAVIPHRDGYALTLAFTPDGKTLAVGRDRGSIGLIDLETRKPVRGWQAHEGDVKTLSFSPDGKLVASADHREAEVYLWNAATGKNVAVYKLHEGLGHTDQVAFSPDGTRLAVAGRSLDVAISLWDVTKHVERWLLKGHKHATDCVAFSPDGKLLVTGSQDKTVIVWDVPMPD